MVLPVMLPGTAPVQSRCPLHVQEEVMEKSVGQARWLLALTFAVAITFMAIGITLG